MNRDQLLANAERASRVAEDATRNGDYVAANAARADVGAWLHLAQSQFDYTPSRPPFGFVSAR